MSAFDKFRALEQKSSISLKKPGPEKMVESVKSSKILFDSEPPSLNDSSNSSSTSSIQQPPPKKSRNISDIFDSDKLNNKSDSRTIDKNDHNLKKSLQQQQQPIIRQSDEKMETGSESRLSRSDLRTKFFTENSSSSEKPQLLVKSKNSSETDGTKNSVLNQTSNLGPKPEPLQKSATTVEKIGETCYRTKAALILLRHSK